jgi:hypothetical protein
MIRKESLTSSEKKSPVLVIEPAADDFRRSEIIMRIGFA